MDYIPENPKRVRLHHDDNNPENNELYKILNYIYQAEKEHILDQRGSPINKNWLNLIQLLIFTGARPIEIQTLKQSDIVIDKRIAIIIEHKTSKKTGDKIIHLNDPAWKIIEKSINLKSQQNRFKNPYIIMGEGNNNLKRYHRQWWLMCKKINIDVPVYALRRNFASIGQDIFTDSGNGQELNMVQKIIGHSNSEMTAIYAGKNQKIIERQIQESHNNNQVIGNYFSNIKRCIEDG